MIVSSDAETILGANAGSSVSPTDLAELMGVFNDVTSKLERTHEQLRNEVSRLNTELAHANEALQRSKRLAALGEMAAGISHEIRNPLGSIKLYTRMLMDDLADQPSHVETLGKIDRAIRGLDLIVGDVLSFSRELRLRPAPWETRELLEGSIESCAAELAEIETRIEVDPDAAMLEIDRSLAIQALVNLVRNAAQSTRESGGRTVVLGARRISDDDGDPCVELFVRDSGSGIDQEVIERMFNPFFTTRAAGTGLGLAIVHRIMDAHGGSVRVVNNEGRGATVSLLVPIELSLAHAPDVVVRAGGMPTPLKEAV
jgi:signal transduction histidine kinase